ncbi:MULTISPECIES: DUF982 domain-containing protein [unclassified Chelatococcus]|uniref:DUF982 domain-containing protein n=1 Tax=unclassified Chelatococcus TaxID=2638111 RepID=UPI001BCCEC17|nr:MULTISPECIES: DUF982 domain-containing protein [unclassified Chelatococcus]MBS7697828.1 DUF982 domain-containing protein [Chelatococcus sp. YT9]MBS7698560.1 DUF982 domain-containing protein [Chelatococcus sp. YT9]MBX3559817.1 DUF982 domain-containing protein [Chelatococcus sp.]
MPRLWFEPVDIWISDSTRRTVTSVEEAARMLMEKWPEEFATSKKHLAARKACLAALADPSPASAAKARAALIKAAEEAGMG